MHEGVRHKSLQLEASVSVVVVVVVDGGFRCRSLLAYFKFRGTRSPGVRGPDVRAVAGGLKAGVRVDEAC